MKEQIDTLVKLQQIEMEALKIHALIDNLPENIRGMDAKITEFETLINQETLGLEENKKRYRGLESDVKSNNSKILKKEDQLRSVKNNKEYQALLKEIEDLKALNSRIEDEMIGYLESMEKGESALQEQKESFESLRKQIAAEKENAIRQAEEAKKVLSELEDRKKGIVELIEPDLLDKFNLLKDAKGVAIVSVMDAICDGCKMKIPPQMYNELQRVDSLRYCPSCHRMIYWEKCLDAG